MVTPTRRDYEFTAIRRCDGSGCWLVKDQSGLVTPLRDTQSTLLIYLCSEQIQFPGIKGKQQTAEKG
jgi:hypothetical protein